MDLFDVMEMLVDWMAATKKHKTGDISESLIINAKRFGISDQLLIMMCRTVQNFYTADSDMNTKLIRLIIETLKKREGQTNNEP